MRMSDEEFESVVDTNLNGVFRVVKRVTKSMLRQKFGRVILIGSVVGLLGSAGAGQLLRHKECFGWNCAFYHSRDRRQEHHRHVVAPGFIDTDMTAALSEELAATYRSRIPAGRFASRRKLQKWSDGLLLKRRPIFPEQSSQLTVASEWATR